MNLAVRNIKGNYVDFNIIGFSIGGTIGWKHALHHSIEKLICVSATRLRFESKRPPCPISVCYGENDINQPNPRWYDLFDPALSKLVIEGDHSIYKNDEMVEKIVRFLNV